MNITFETTFIDDPASLPGDLHDSFNDSLNLSDNSIDFCGHYLPDNERAIIYVMYALIFVVSLIGNGVVCYIVIATPRMRTVTNYFIANLAVGDMLITLLCVPFTSISQTEQYWPFYELLCPVTHYAQAISVFVSSYTMVAISVDRYVAIMWPLRPRLAKRTTAFLILVIWVFAAVTVMPTARANKMSQPSDWHTHCKIFMCQEDLGLLGEDYGRLYSKALSILQFVVPLSVLLFTYTSIGIVIWCHQIPGEAENCRDQRIAKSKRKMVKMMVAVVLVYTICWMPLNVFLTLNDLGVPMENKMVFWFCSHWFAMSHSCYNPIIYCYMNHRFRQSFVQIFGIVPCFRSRCPSACMNDRHGRMSIPLTNIGGSDSTILHRNNTCTTYISTRRRNGNGLNQDRSNYQHPQYQVTQT